MTHKAALLIVDVQLGMFDEDDPVYNGHELLQTLGGLIARAREAGAPVVYVQHQGRAGHPLAPDAPGYPIHPAIAPRSGEAVVTKRTPDSFHETTLQEELAAGGIERIVLAGIQTELCIDTTCRRASSLGYDVTLVSDGHSTWDRGQLSAPQIIAHHNDTLDGWFASAKPAREIAFEGEPHRRLLELLARGQADQDTLAERLSPEERAARGELYAWSAKDHVAHNNFWRQDAVRRLQAALDGGSPPDTEDDLAWNDRVFQEQRETAWEELVAETGRLRAETATLIQRFSPDDLTQKDRYPWQRGGSLERLILTNWYEHPAEHWGDIYVSRNELDRAIELRQAVVRTVGELFAHNPTTYGYVIYNLGCFYARNGRPEQAIGAIREAFVANPSLVEWSRQDTDLDSLRALPAFQALYEG